MDAMFRYGAGRAGLACVAGGLIVDSGEEDATFVLRCQDRYPVYTALAGLRSVLFVLDDAHADLYADRLADLGRRLALVHDRTGVLDVAVEPPLFVGYDPVTGTVHATQATENGLKDDAIRAAARAGLCANQVSPTYARLLAEVDRLFAGAGVETGWDQAALARQAELCQAAYDKADAASLVDDGVAPHAATAVVDPDALFAVRDWAAIETWLPGARRVVVKSSCDSGGNVAVTLGPDDVVAGVTALREQWRHGLLDDAAARERALDVLRRKVRESWLLGPLGVPDELLAATVAARAGVRRARAPRLLVQEYVAAPPSAVPSVGASFVVGDGSVAPLAVAQQVFADAGRTKHLGSLLSAEVDAAFAPYAEGYAALAARYAARGYRGPIGFDAVWDGTAYVGVLDCNPRLTAVFPALAVRDALRAAGLPCDSLLDLDYRGLFTWPDAAERLAALAGLGLLYTRRSPRGVLPVPNLVGPHAYDVHLVNLSAAEVDDLLARRLLGSAADYDKGQIDAVHR